MSGLTDAAARAPWSGVMKRGQIMRLIDLEGQQAVDALLYSADNPTERYSAQDTLLEQGSAYIGLGSRLLSNHGRPQVSATKVIIGRRLFL
jgi:uncharacterized protein YcgI (DUF1989 family)